MTRRAERTIVAALGGNALLRRGEAIDPVTQLHNVSAAAEQLAVLAQEAPLVVTHGNGPQVGLLASQADSRSGSSPFPLDVLGAETEGMIGYLIEQELGNRLPHRRIATLVTRVEVDADDPAFARPSKPIGAVYDEATAARFTTDRGWTIAADGPGFRRVVPSPAPRRVLELDTIQLLLDSGCIIVCAGGGGIPVCRTAAGFVGVEAVIDKDATAALIAELLRADLLLLLTDVDAVYTGFGTPDQAPLGRVTPPSLRRETFAAGSMGPKVEAACRFVERTGGRAAIGRLEDAVDLADAAGTRGTRISSS